jgi:hypothetical protein
MRLLCVLYCEGTMRLARACVLCCTGLEPTRLPFCPLLYPPPLHASCPPLHAS